MDQWGYNYLTVEKIVGKGEIVVRSNFFFSHNVFKSCLLLMRQNEYLWSRVNSLPKEKLRALVDDKINVTIKLKFVLRRVENLEGKGEKCCLLVVSPFPTIFSKGFFLRVI